MAATDHLGPQFPKDSADKDYDKAAEYDAKGADESTSFGYSAEDMADYQYARYGKDETDTSPGRETF